METWNDNLDGLFNSHGFNRLKELNKQLQQWCDEWIIQVNRYDGLHASLSTSYPYQSVIQVKQSSSLSTSFFCRLEYCVTAQNTIELRFKAVSGFNYGAYIRKTMKSECDASEFYVCDETIFEGKEIFEKGFVLENINIAIDRFFRWYEERRCS